jgi:hypothetical protein
MICRPAWEKKLRRAVRGRATRRSPGEWLGNRWLALLFCWGFAKAFAESGRLTHGPLGAGVGVAILAGLAGFYSGSDLRSRLEQNLWVGLWTPAGARETRRLQVREAVAPVALDLAMVWLLCGIGLWADDGGSNLASFAGWPLAAAVGFALAGGKWGRGLLYLCGLGVVGLAFLSVWSGSGARTDFYQRVVSGAALGWPPSWPWAMISGGGSRAVLQGTLLAVTLGLSWVEWRRAWRSWEIPLSYATPPMPPPDESGQGEATPPEECGEDASTAEAAELQRSDVRKSVAFGWVGMAGYLALPLSPLGRLLWRMLTPRERFLCCLGSHQERVWFQRTGWAAALLAAAVVISLLPRWVTLADDHFAAWIVTIGLPGMFAFYLSWPARQSIFEPWLERMTTESTGAFPVFAVLPVTAREWLHAVGKEWLVRGSWSFLLWAAALTTAYAGQSGDASPRGMFVLALLPAVVIAALFPLSVAIQAARAVAGPLLATHGSTRVLPAILLATVCVGSAVFGLVVGTFANHGQTIALVSLTTAVATGWTSLRFTRMRCEGRRLDLKPKPLA